LVREFGAEEAAAKYEVDENDLMMLRRVFNRGDFTEGYLFGNPREDILSGASPKNQGIYLGRVAAIIDSEGKVTEADERAAVRGALRRGKVLACITMDKSAKDMGADYMVTACPLCQYNLTRNADDPIPVRYFTEVLAEALGLIEE
jgi:hypothetical protein